MSARDNFSPEPDVKTNGSDALRDIQIIRNELGFIIAGTEAWAQPATPILLLHDIFHHDPKDDGSMACEMMSYGAQVWIEHHTDEIRLGVSYDELSAVIEGTAELKTAAEAAAIFTLPQAPVHAAIEERFLARFKEIATEAFQESAMAEALVKIPDEEMSLICDEPNLDRCAAWMSYGFTRARERFPDPEATHQLFNKLHIAVKKWAELDKTELRIALDEQRSEVASPDTDFEHILETLEPGQARVRKARP